MRPGMSQLMRAVCGLPVEAPKAEAAGADAGVLARELSQAFIDQLWKFRNARDAQDHLADEVVLGWEKRLQMIREKPPDRVTFQEIESLSREHPEEALARWEEVKAAARQDLANGWQAARGVSGESWDRACFLAIREQLHLLWPPRNGVEAMLLDEIAQYEMLRRKMIDQFRQGSWVNNSVRGKEYTATVELGRMAERLQKMIHYALRTLVGIRRSQAPAFQRGVTAAVVEE